MAAVCHSFRIKPLRHRFQSRCVHRAAYRLVRPPCRRPAEHVPLLRTGQVIEQTRLTMTEPTLDTRKRLDQVEGSAQLSVRRRAAAGEAPTRRTSLASWASRVSVAVIGLAAFGCVVVRATEPDIQSALPMLALFALVLVGGAVFVVASGMLVVVSRRRHRRKLEKILVAVFAGLVCGALWVLIVATVVNAARPGAMMGPAVLGVGVVTALGAAILLLRPDSLSEVVGLSAMTIGFHSLVLPIGALIAFLVGGAQWLPATSARPALAAVILGVRLAGDPSTVGLSLGGLLLGLFLVFLGDRALRGARRRMSRPRPRFDLSRPDD